MLNIDSRMLGRILYVADKSESVVLCISFFHTEKPCFDKNKLNGTYVYRHKHNYIPYSTFTITKVQLHVSAINVGHLQLVHEALNDKLYLHVSGGVYSLWGGVGARSCFVFVEGVWIGTV